nr:immunoglobulin light chain junction region [Macaca mulatta]
CQHSYGPPPWTF